MIRVAFISFLVNSINTRTLSSYLKENRYQSICLFCQGNLHQDNIDQLIKIIIEKDVSLVGISLVTDDYQSAAWITDEIKRKTEIPVIWGGAHVNVAPEECLHHADMICMGEGEEALLDLVQCMSMRQDMDMGIKNIWFRTEEGIIRNELRNLEENLDKYPFPDFDLFSQYVMTEKGFATLQEQHLKGAYSIMTSRGCPYSCSYCYNSYRKKHYEGKGKYLRKRSICKVIAELKEAKKRFPGLKEINFWDDSFVAREIEEFILFRDLYRKEIGLPFFALIEPMAFKVEKIQLLKEAGLKQLQIGIQTGSERVNRDIYRRPISNQRILNVVREIKALGIDATYDLIFNNPYETKQDIRETVNLLMAFPRPFSLQGYNLIFYPGTEITEKALQDGYISLRQENDDYSKIQGKENSPIAMRGTGKISHRFYDVHFDSQEKHYLNSLLALMASKKVPGSVIRFFAKSETTARRMLLKAFISFYATASRIKNRA